MFNLFKGVGGNVLQLSTTLYGSSETKLFTPDSQFIHYIVCGIGSSSNPQKLNILLYHCFIILNP